MAHLSNLPPSVQAAVAGLGLAGAGLVEYAKGTAAQRQEAESNDLFLLYSADRGMRLLADPSRARIPSG